MTLKINVEKLSYIMFSSKHKITMKSTDEIALYINDITLDETLPWGPHVNNIFKKLGQHNGMLCRLISVLPREYLKCNL